MYYSNPSNYFDGTLIICAWSTDGRYLSSIKMITNPKGYCWGKLDSSTSRIAADQDFQIISSQGRSEIMAISTGKAAKRIIPDLPDRQSGEVRGNARRNRSFSMATRPWSEASNPGSRLPRIRWQSRTCQVQGRRQKALFCLRHQSHKTAWKIQLWTTLGRKAIWRQIGAVPKKQVLGTGIEDQQAETKDSTAKRWTGVPMTQERERERDLPRNSQFGWRKPSEAHWSQNWSADVSRLEGIWPPPRRDRRLHWSFQRRWKILASTLSWDTTLCGNVLCSIRYLDCPGFEGTRGYSADRNDELLKTDPLRRFTYYTKLIKCRSGRR